MGPELAVFVSAILVGAVIFAVIYFFRRREQALSWLARTLSRRERRRTTSGR
jgi:predicted PurR-regulated permease PerM